MNKMAAMLILIFASGTLTGCLAVVETQHDQEKIRTALNTLYENQVMDNLIRAANSLPFVQIDYTNATTTVTVTRDGEIGAMPTLETTRDLSLPGKALMLTKRVFTNALTYNIKAGNSNQVTLTANPVTDVNAVYDAYLSFLDQPGSLVVSCDSPPACEVHIMRKWRGKYYWVPVDYRTLFLRLALVTTFQRGKPLQPADKFFTVQVDKSPLPPTGSGDGPIFLTVKVDPPIPTDTGKIEFTVDGAPIKFDIEPPSAVPRPATTSSIVIVFDPKKGGKSFPKVADLMAHLPTSAKLYLDNNRPEPKDTDELLKSVRFQLEQIRLNQVRRSL